MAIEILADLDEIEPGTAEWLELRRVGIGGSDAGAVCGLSQWATPYQVWAEKVNTAPAVIEEEPEYVTWGRILEPVVRDQFSLRTEIEVHRFPKMVRNPEYPFMLASVDGLTGPVERLTGAYEGKTTRRGDQWPIGDDGAVQVPLPYMVQGMHYLAVLGLEVVHFACLIGGQELRIAEVARDEELIADLIEIEEAFWRQVLEQEPPPVGAGDVKVLRSRWTPEAGKVIELAGLGKELQRRAELKTQIRTLEADVDEIDASIMAAMGDAETATYKGKVAVTWKQSTRRTLNKEKLLEAHPGLLLDTYTDVTSSRRFLPKEITDGDS